MRILIVKLHALGDLVIITPAVRRLYEGLENAEIHLLTTAWAEPGIRHHPLINKTIVVPTDVFFKKSLKSVQEQITLINKVRTEKYDAAVIFHRHRFIRNLFKLSAIDRQFSFGYETRDNRIYLDEKRHSVLTACELSDLAVTKLGGLAVNATKIDKLQYEWYSSNDELNKAKEVLSHHLKDQDKFVVIFPGGGQNPSDEGFERRWGTDGFREIVDYCSDKYGLKVILLGSDSDNEVCQCIQNNKSDNVVNLAGEYDFRITAALTKQAIFAISNDSAPLHMSAAVGVPVIGIFGPTGAQYKLPPGKNCYSVATGIECSPCYFTVFKGCVHDEFKCMTQLSPEMVFEKIDVIMSKSYLGNPKT